MNYANTAIFAEAAAPAPTTSYLLDEVGVGAIAALGFYQLSSTYLGNCIKVRRVSDNATQDIGFVDGVLDTSAIASFCGAADGTIATWYDQSGNGFNWLSTNNPQAGTIANEPIIYYNSAITTDAGGNIAAYSIDPGSTSVTGARFLNSPAMTARNKPTLTYFAQMNTFNGNGILHTELDNGYNIGTYGASVPTNSLRVIRSNGNNLVAVATIRWDATDPFVATVWYNDDATGKFWVTSELNGAPFETSFGVDGFNAPTYDNASIFRYYSPTLYQNSAMNGYIYWDLPDGTTLSPTEVNSLYTWVENNLGYINNAP